MNNEEVHKKMGYKKLPPEVEAKIQTSKDKEMDIIGFIENLEDDDWTKEAKKQIQIGFMCLRKSIAERAIKQKIDIV